MIINANKHKVFFTSDLHFCHKNIIKYCKRPYSNTYEMNNDIIKVINSYANNNDYLFNLGDIGMSGSNVLLQLYSKIDANQFLISGNHDRKSLLNKLDMIFTCMFKEKTVLNIDYNGIEYIVYLSHYPRVLDYVDDDKTIFLYGHLHEKELEDCRWNEMNIGWDRFQKPISFQEIIKIMNERK